MVIVAIFITFVGIYLMQDDGVLTQKSLKKASSTALIIISALIIINAYGILKGVFVYLGLLSLIGTIFTLFLYKVQNIKES